MSSRRRVRLGDLAVTLDEPAAQRRGTILLLHGIGGSADTFAGLAPRLAADGWRTIAWDAPGYGESADPGPGFPGADAPGTYVAAVTALLTELGVSQVHLAGVSWGGVIATHVATRRPEVVASLTLIDSTRGSGRSAERAAAMRGRAPELERVGAAAYAAARAPRLLADAADPAVAAEVERQMAALRASGYAGAAEMMAQSDTGAALSGIGVPTLVLVGDQDRVTGVDESRLLAQTIPGARLGLIGHAGHAAVQERPAAVAEAISTFLAELPASEKELLS